VGNACPLRVALGMSDREPGSMPGVDERGERGRQVVKSCLPTQILGWRSDGVNHSQD
jgi:hypothetical protein